MFKDQHDCVWRSPFLRVADEIVVLELIWPFPLLVLGVLGIQDLLLVGISVALALMPWLARWLVFGRVTRRAYVAGALGLLSISALVGIWAAYDPALSWPTLLTLLGSVCLFFAIVNSDSSPWKLGRGLVIVASLVAVYFVGQYAHFDYQGEVGRLAHLGRMTSSLMPALVLFVPHPNAVAGFIESALLLSLVLARRARTPWRLVAGLAAVVIAYGLLISGSRGSWVGLAVALGVWSLLLIPSPALRLVLVTIGAVGGILGAYIAVGLVIPNRPVFVLTSAMATAASRFTLYRNSLHLLGDYPFTGIGLGDTFAMVYSRYQLLILVPFLTYSHNLFLSVALGQGALGLTALVWLLISFYHFVFRVERTGLDAQRLPLFRAAWLGATTTFVHGLTDSPQFSASRWTMPMLFAFLGLTVMIGRPALARPRHRERRRGWKETILAAIIVILMAVGAVFQGPLASAWYANLGAVCQTRADLSTDLDEAAREAVMAQAVTYFERALSLNLSQPVANRRLGMIALDREDYDAAVSYLERAYPHEAGNQATLKALGYAYLWSGRLDPAEELFQKVDFRSELMKELEYWRWWWGARDRQDLSRFAEDMARRLSGNR